MTEPRKPRRSFTLSLDPDLAVATEHFRVSHGFESTGEAVRGLMRIALASTPEDGMEMMMRARGYNEVRVWALTQFHRLTEEMSQMFRDALRNGGSSSSSPGAPPA